MKKIIRLTESDLVRLVKRVINEQGTSVGIPLIELPQQEKTKLGKEIWKQVSHNSELKHELHIMPHHNEHNFLNDIGHKIHVKLDPKTQHAHVEFLGLDKKYNLSLNLGLSYDPHHYEYGLPTNTSVGLKYNFGGGHKKEQPKPKW